MIYLTKLAVYTSYIGLFAALLGTPVRAYAESDQSKTAGNVAVSTDGAPAALRMVIIGDSLTAGYGVAKADAYPAQLQKLINSQEGLWRPIQIVVAGISGSTSASLNKRLAWQMKKKPDAIMLALGANDGLRGLKPSQMKANLLQAIETSEREGVQVILAGMKMPVNYGKDYREQYEAVYAGLGQRDSLIYVPFLLDGVGGVKELNQADAIHPNEKGHKKIAENLWAQLQNKAFFLSLKQPANRSPKDEGQK